MFGAEAGATLATGHGQPEDALRTPLVGLVKTVAGHLGVGAVVPVGETRLEELEVRPDYAIEVGGAVCGYIEIKRPGLGADAPALTGKQNVRQWQRLSDLPNLIYTDGVQWARYSHGERDGDIVVLDGDFDPKGPALAPPDAGLQRLLSTFLDWDPPPIRSVGALVRAVAPLCRLLRDEVVDQLGREQTRIKQGQPTNSQPFTGLAADWRTLLFPGASDPQFADGYAQTVTFALLLARSRGVPMDTGSIHTVGHELGASSALMGRALQLLTDHVENSFRVTLGTLLRVVAAIDWDKVRGGRRDTYLYLYEEFLEAYDDDLRKSSGSYYTPVDVAAQMVRLADDVVRSRLERPEGLGAPGVSVIDPAAGTGTFLLRILETVYERLADDDGPGAAREPSPTSPPACSDSNCRWGLTPSPSCASTTSCIASACRSPPVVASGCTSPTPSTTPSRTSCPPPPPPSRSPTPRAAPARSRPPCRSPSSSATRPTASAPSLTAAGSPTARGPSSSTSWTASRLPGNGRTEYVLHNLAWYFWRWGTWKVFDRHAGSDEHGVVALITTAAYLRGPGFAGMRRYLRRTCDEGWIIDLTPEGMQPDVATRIFPGVQQTLAIGIFLRRSPQTPLGQPARIRYRAVHGRRADKFAALAEIGLDDDGWADTRTAPDTAPFTPAHATGWDDYPALTDLLPVVAPGINPSRTWVYAPREETLDRRWRHLVSEPDIATKRALFKESSSRSIDSVVSPLPGYEAEAKSIAQETSLIAPNLVRIAFRNFDRQYTYTDHRVFHRSSVTLWAAALAEDQIFAVEMHSSPIRSGPGLVFTSLIPDKHAFKGSEGGRAMPTRHSSAASVVPARLRKTHGAALGGDAVDGDDLVAYIAAIVAHPGYTARFAEQLETPGVRVPLTTNPELWAEAVELGRRVLWLHTYGERCIDPAAGRPTGAVAAAGEHKVRNLDGIASTSDGMPTAISHSSDPGSRRDPADGEDTLYLDEARFAPVPAAVWRYDVGGRSVVKSWFDYRRRDPAGRRSSPLDDINPTTWAKSDTEELLRLLGVLRGLVDLEAAQAALLDAVCAGPLLSFEQLNQAGALPNPHDRKLR